MTRTCGFDHYKGCDFWCKQEKLLSLKVRQCYSEMRQGEAPELACLMEQSKWLLDNYYELATAIFVLATYECIQH